MKALFTMKVTHPTSRMEENATSDNYLKKKRAVRHENSNCLEVCKERWFM
jgi:hypothetical protein